MSTIDDGGSAFPHHFFENSVGDCSGMSLRDYFAAKALAGYVATEAANDFRGVSIEENDRAIAEHCYALADSMLAARKADPQP